MKTKSFIICIFFIITIALFFNSCSKDDIDLLNNNIVIDKSITIVDGKMNFPSHESFEDLMTQMHNIEKPELDNETYSKFQERGFTSLSNKKVINNLKAGGEDEFVDDTLVQDPFFASLLNENREISVNGVVYKITEQGTFFAPNDKLDRINEIIDNIGSSKKSEQIGTLVSENLYEVEDGVYLFDSFRASETVDVYEYEDMTAASAGSTNPYGDIESHNFDAHTIVGGWIQGLFGRTRAYNRNFSDSRRVRVNFYSVNYVVYSAIGINVTYQKKNWIGWSKTDCAELRMGWDGIIYSYKLNYSVPLSGPGSPVRSEYSYVPGIKTKKAFTINVLDHEISIDYAMGLTVVKNYTWNWLQNNLAPEAVKWRAEQLKQFREIFPNEVKVIVDQYEEIKTNVSSISKTFDWGTCQISINFLNGSSFLDIVGLEDEATDFDVEKISIYGIAKKDGNYKGVRIVKY